jgi:1,4-dihydroxy-6-naphthoate synthase
MLLERDLIRVDHDTLQTYLGLYANDDSIKLSPLQFKALDKLYSLGFEHGFYDELIKAEDYLIPDEYKELRNS